MNSYEAVKKRLDLSSNGRLLLFIIKSINVFSNNANLCSRTRGGMNDCWALHLWDCCAKPFPLHVLLKLFKTIIVSLYFTTTSTHCITDTPFKLWKTSGVIQILSDVFRCFDIVHSFQNMLNFVGIFASLIFLIFNFKMQFTFSLTLTSTPPTMILFPLSSHLKRAFM